MSTTNNNNRTKPAPVMLGDRRVFHLTPYRAICLIEGTLPEADQEDIKAAWQYLIDTGIALGRGSPYLKTALKLISDGNLRAPPYGKN